MSLTVIIPTRNHAAYLPQCLEAILSQDLPAADVIVVDDASTDDTPEILGKYSGIRVIRNEMNIGPAECVNRVLRETKTEYVAFFASDDYILPGFFKAALSLLKKHPEIGLCCGDHFELHDDKIPYLIHINTLNQDAEMICTPRHVQRLFKKTHLIIPSQATIYRTSCVLEAGLFNPSLFNLCDWYVNIYCALHFGMAYIPRDFATMRIFNSSYGGSANQNRFIRKLILKNLFSLLDRPDNLHLKRSFTDCRLFSHFNYRFFCDFALLVSRWPMTFPSFFCKIKRLFLKRFYASRPLKIVAKADK